MTAQEPATAPAKILAEKILVVAAHSDDEALGCGGTIAKHTRAGQEVALLFMTDGVGAREDAGTTDVEQRSRAMEQALRVMNVGYHRQFGFPDNALDSVPLLHLAQAVESFCQEWGTPDRVYTHHAGDLNVDHRLTRQAVMTCFRPQPERCGKPAKILSFEVPSSTHWSGMGDGMAFVPNYYIDISATLDIKLAALAAYAAEMRDWPHARSVRAVEHLARYRGSVVGVEAAEGFVVERVLEP